MTQRTRLPETIAVAVGVFCLLLAPVNASAVVGLVAVAVAVIAFTTAGALWQLV